MAPRRFVDKPGCVELVPEPITRERLKPLVIQVVAVGGTPQLQSVDAPVDAWCSTTEDGAQDIMRAFRDAGVKDPTPRFVRRRTRTTAADLIPGEVETRSWCRLLRGRAYLLKVTGIDWNAAWRRLAEDEELRRAFIMVLAASPLSGAGATSDQQRTDTQWLLQHFPRGAR